MALGTTPVTVDPSSGVGPGPAAAGPQAELPRVNVSGYVLAREIGRGGQAVVFEATQTSTGRRVAVKLLREAALASPQQRARLDREVQVLAALNHPNIVQIIDRGTTTEGALYVVMQ